MTQSGYFSFATKVALGVGIIDGKILFCHGISDKTKEKMISIRDYNDRTVYGCFNNHFPSDFCSPALSVVPRPIYDSPHLNKRARYTSDRLSAAIYVTSGKYVSTFTTPDD